MVKRAHQKTLRRLIRNHFASVAIKYPTVCRPLTTAEVTSLTRRIGSQMVSLDPPKGICYSLASVPDGHRATSITEVPGMFIFS